MDEVLCFVCSGIACDPVEKLVFAGWVEGEYGFVCPECVDNGALETNSGLDGLVELTGATKKG